METDSKPHYKILLVDDDTFLLNMYSLKFTKSGFEIETYSNSTEALKKIESGFSPDIILLDIIMPGMSGLELLEKIRAEKLVPEATIIMLTNESNPADIEKAKSLGVQGYIVKATTVPSEVVGDTLKIHENNIHAK